MVKLNIFVPLRVSPDDALVLQKAANSQKVTRSTVLRQLIRALDEPRSSGSSNPQQKPEATTAA